MTLDRHDETPDDGAEHAVLDDAGTVDTTSIGILGAPTAQVRVALPLGSEDDLVEDDDVVVDEVHVDELDTGDIILEDLPLAQRPPEVVEVEDADEIAVEQVDDEAVVEELATDGDEPVSQVLAATVAWREATEAALSETPDPDAAPVDDLEPADDVEPVDDAEPTTAVETAEPAGEQSADLVTGDVPAQTEPPARTVAAGAPVGAPVPLTGGIPTTRREAHHAAELSRGERAHAVERVALPPVEQNLAAKRLGELSDRRESSDLLTADRLLDRAQLSGAEPEGLWQQLVYSLSRHRINLGDSKKAKARKDLDRRIAASLPGGARFVPVLSRKGGVGKTTITTLLGMALAAARDDRVIAVDANPDRGTLADRIGGSGGRTVRDLARTRAEVSGYSDISAIVGRDETRLDVLASDSDPRVSEAFSDRDYHDVATLAAHYYSIVLTDTGTGIVHSVMGATLELADEIVVVAGLSVDEARLASETLTWLETNGYAEQVRNAVVVLNNARPGAPLVRESELEAHFRTRVRAVIRMPYDPLIGTGSAISFRDLQPATRTAARRLAAAVVEGLRSMAPAA